MVYFVLELFMFYLLLLMAEVLYVLGLLEEGEELGFGFLVGCGGGELGFC